MPTNYDDVSKNRKCPEWDMKWLYDWQWITVVVISYKRLFQQFWVNVLHGISGSIIKVKWTNEEMKK